MTFTSVRSWAKEKGYSVKKIEVTRDDGSTANEYHWSKSDSNDTNNSGVSPSVSKVARAIYNHMTDNKWVDYQKEYDERKSKGEIDYEKGLY